MKRRKGFIKLARAVDDTRGTADGEAALRTFAAAVFEARDEEEAAAVCVDRIDKALDELAEAIEPIVVEVEPRTSPDEDVDRV